MFKAVLLASSIIFVPGIAAAQVAVSDPVDRVSYSVGIDSNYILEKQAFTVEGPVVNADVTYQVNDNLSFTAWGQYGERDEATEIDLTATLAETFGSIDVSVTGGGYFYPVGDLDPIYMARIEAAVPMGPVSLELSAERNEGGFENTTFAVAISGSVHDTVDLTFGKAFNTGDINPWFVGASVPVGPEDLGISVDARVYFGAGEGWTVGLRKSF